MTTLVQSLPLAAQILHVKTAVDIEAIISRVPDAHWLPLGGRPNNAGIVNVGADPADALVERLTNAMDALIEREEALQEVKDLPSPRKAVEVLFGIPGGRLAHLPTAKRRELAQQLQFYCRESGERRRPTIVVEDHGIGQHPDVFEKTLLSLNESNKVGRPELIGAYGQGGASVFAFTEHGALIVARRDPALLSPEQQDLVGWSIVRFNPLDENFKSGVYEYLVVPDGRGGYQIPRFLPAELPGDFRDFVGCHFVAVEYPIEKYSSVAVHASGGLWQLANLALFDPVYPILVRDERPRATSAKDPKNAVEGIVAFGNTARLEEDKKDKVEYYNISKVTLSDGGTAIVRYWVLKSSNATGDAKKKDWELRDNYVPSEQSVTITLNGQRQGSWRREMFERAALASISKYLIVQVDCDGLTRMAKRGLFSSTRDRIKSSPVAAELEVAVRNAIASDTQLRELDRERKQKALAGRSEAESKKINDWLRKEINSLKQGNQQIFRKVISTNTEYQLLGNQPLLDEAVGNSPQLGPGFPEVDVLDLITDPEAEPTDLRVINPTIHVPAGGAGVVRLAMDAPDDFISPEPGQGKGTFTAQFTKGQSLFRLTGYSAIRRGVMRATIEVPKGVPTGERGRVIFAVTRPFGLPLLAEADVVTVAPPQARAKPAGTRPGSEAGPRVEPVTREGWLEMGYPDDVVAFVEDDPATQEVVIYVQQEYSALMNRLQREAVDEQIQVNYQSKFVAAMALAAWLQHEAKRKQETSVPQEVLEAELRRAAEVFVFTQFVSKDSSEFGF